MWHPFLYISILCDHCLSVVALPRTLSQFYVLIIFSLLRNPVTNKKHYRLYVISKIPQIRVLDFQKVKLKVSEGHGL